MSSRHAQPQEAAHGGSRTRRGGVSKVAYRLDSRLESSDHPLITTESAFVAHVGSWPAPAKAQMSETISHYTVLEPLGRGGMDI